MEVFEISTRKGGLPLKKERRERRHQNKNVNGLSPSPICSSLCGLFLFSRPFGVVGASLPAGGPLRRSLAKDERWRKVVTLKKESLDGLEKESFCAVSWKRDFFPFPPSRRRSLARPFEAAAPFLSGVVNISTLFSHPKFPGKIFRWSPDRRNQVVTGNEWPKASALPFFSFSVSRSFSGINRPITVRPPTSPFPTKSQEIILFPPSHDFPPLKTQK